MGKNRGKVRNRARDMLCDYYVTNEKYRCENRRRQRKGDRGLRSLTKSEKIYLFIIVAGIVCICIKYFVM